MNAEKRNIGELRQIGSLIVSICDKISFEIENCEKARLAAGYWKAKFFGRDDLVSKCLEQLQLSKTSLPFKSIDDMELEGELSAQDAAFLRNYLNE